MVLRTLIGGLLLAACYLLFAGQVSPTEAAAGAISLAIAGAYALCLHHVAARRFSLRAPWAKLVASVAAAIVTDTLRVAAVIIKGGAGQGTHQPFAPGDGTQAGRRAIVTLALSLAPNGIVQRVGEDAILLHRLAPAPSSPDPRWPA